MRGDAAVTLSLQRVPDSGGRRYAGSEMPQNPNDAMWDPRPRLEREAEQVNGGEDVPVEKERREGADRALLGGSGTVMVELESAPGMSPSAAMNVARGLVNFNRETDIIRAVPMGEAGQETFIVRAHVSDDAVVAELERESLVVKVWRDTPIAPF